MRLSHSENDFFRGFQIICESCEFLNLPKSDAQFNTKYCNLPGRVCHTSRVGLCYVVICGSCVAG